jgi:DNA-binding NarL/FixJ family response regulator
MPATEPNVFISERPDGSFAKDSGRESDRPNATPIRVVLADDHELVRVGVRMYCRHVPGIVIVGEAGNGVDLIELVKRYEPDLVITDLSMPQMDGEEAIRRIRAHRPKVPIIVFSFHDETDCVLSALRAGANAFLCKDSLSGELVRAVRAVMAGRFFVSARIAGQIAHELAGRHAPAERAPRARAAVKEALSDRERAVIRMLADGKSSREIAKEMGLTVSTVDVHRHNVMKKLGLASAAGIVKFAIKNGLANG